MTSPSEPSTEFLFSPAAPDPAPGRSPLRAAITQHWLADETALVGTLLAQATLPADASAVVQARAADWVRRVRLRADRQSAVDAFMREYDLSSEEGVVLMCLAEALLRIPDDATAEKLIADKLSDADWEGHLGRSDSLFVNAGTWGLLLTGRIVRLSSDTTRSFGSAMNRLLNRSTEPVIRLAIRHAMRLMGNQFVMGRTIEEALDNASSRGQRDYRHSFDMLGEAALTAADAERYLAAYHMAIQAIGRKVVPGTALHDRPSISVKLSALHPRYEVAKRPRVLAELTPRLLSLARAAKEVGIGMTVDAEEADRLELSLDVFEAVFRDKSLDGWDGLGLAVQAFQKRCPALIDWLQALAHDVGRCLPVRLVKGAYWDTEVKRSQEGGLPGYPVYTRKGNTDVAYLACARKLLAARDVFYPMFATHNAQTVAAVRAYAGEHARFGDTGYEFQRLHGMGEALYEVVREDVAVPCRVYAPVGSHADLLPYLVRRLLENGANTSFVNRIYDAAVPPEQLVADPVAAVAALAVKPNPSLPLPADLYGPARRNSAGINLASEIETSALARALTAAKQQWAGRMGEPLRSLVAVETLATTASKPIHDPSDRRVLLGQWQGLDPKQVDEVMRAAAAAQPAWNAQAVEARAQMLEKAAAALESRRAEFLMLLIREAGKTLNDAIAEVRECEDFLRYYAMQARRLLARPEVLPGPTGEHNELQLHGRGVFVCISPWNFPLAIFGGQVAAALIAGNAVVAKPAEQTNAVALGFVQLLHEAGIPKNVLQCVLGEGDVGAALVSHPLVSGVAFTGSVSVAQAINRSLANRKGPIATLIAETGGQNAMIVDSSALPEQVVKDAIYSAFLSAGQRCSALRILCIQQEIADKVIEMLRGAMRELVIGDPGLIGTDIGPVIDEEAQARLERHASELATAGRVIERLPLPDACRHGTYVTPLVAEIGGIADLSDEHFGPILHVVRFAENRLEELVGQINATGFGLTLGVHSRIETTWRKVQAATRVGNVYINRGMTGAVVGVQPFGGEGLSGTGPKAGGPHYLLRFVTERTLTVNTSAVGGNARLLAQSGDA